MANEYKDQLQDLKDRLRKGKSARQGFERDWYLNVAFYDSDQWVFWNRGHLDRPRVKNRVMLVDNRILPTVDSRIARKTKTRPTFVSTPFSGDETDIKAAELGEKILENDWIQLDLQLKHARAQKLVELTGAAFWKIYWDSTLGDGAEYVFDTSNNQPAVDPQSGRPIRAASQQAAVLLQNGDQFQVQRVQQGNIQVDVNSPFEMVTDPLAEDLNECEWIIEEKVRSKSYIHRRFGEEAASKVKENASAPLGFAESRFANAGVMQRATSDVDYKGITTYEFWAKPNSEFPDGKWCVWTDDQVLLEVDSLDESPFVDNPYIMFRGLIVPGRFWPTCVTSQLRGPQVELNKIKSQIRENAQRIGNPSMLQARTSNVQYSGLPGEQVEYDDNSMNAVPSYLQPPEMPSYVQNEIDRITDAITEISGIHEVSKAQVPSGVTAASAINLLQEADDTRLGPEITDMEKSLADAGGKILKLRAKFTSDERIVRIAGDEGDWDVFSYRGAMLGDNTNVEVQAGSSLPQSKSAKQALMQEMFDRMLQYGIQLDQRAMRKFMREFGIGALEGLFSNIGEDEAQVTRENRQLIKGIEIALNLWDDDDYHIAAHEELLKSQRYDKADDITKQVIVNHWQQHVTRRNAGIEEQLKRQSEMNGAGQGAPQPV